MKKNQFENNHTPKKMNLFDSVSKKMAVIVETKDESNQKEKKDMRKHLFSRVKQKQHKHKSNSTLITVV